jgi:serine/threonine protein kinase
MMEYVSGGLMFNLCQNLGGMGEDAGRFLCRQLIRVMDYMNHKNVVHRDIKIENILFDEYMNIKLADFGFATYKSIETLKTYRGTMSYMAPEIKLGEFYDGRQTDIFSAGVVLFIIVRGIFPFKEARKDEYFYNLIMSGKTEKYFKKIKGEHLSAEFQDLIMKMLAYKGSDRPTLEEVKQHPWLTKPFNK